MYLFPDNHELSLWVSLCIGLFILIASGYAVKELT
ncbi:hypothetical protein GF374_03525 [Candidatus Woesearchaeota archaeon]|nr:hypothetical protein [Candidatus Woesearchaeota archaeon]